MKNEIATTNKELEKITKAIAFDVPELKNLEKEQLKKIAELVVIERYKKEMNKEVDLKKYEYKSLKEIFISSCRTENTKQTYLNSFKKFEKYSNDCAIKNPLSISAATADDFIYSLSNQKLSASTIRITAKCISAFFSFVERRSDGTIRNVFAGSKAMPKQQTKNQNKFYNFVVDENTIENLRKDFNTIIESMPNNEMKAIVFTAMNCGFRVGAFAGLSFHGNKFKTFSKGSEIVGIIPDETMKYIDSLGIKHNKPFENYTDTKLKNLFKYYTKKLFNSGKIASVYSFHDLRHYFSLKEYLTNKDIYSLSKKLNHSSLDITAKYLKGLKVIA